MAGRLVFASLYLFTQSLTILARQDDHSSTPDPSARGLQIRSSAAKRGLSAAQAGVGIGINDYQDTKYTVNITLGGQEFEVLLDTGSSDLYVITDTPLKITNDSGVFASLDYGEGSIAGPIQFAELHIGPYTIPSQAFINVNESQDSDGLAGILGVSFDLTTADETEHALKLHWGNDTALGRTPLANILSLNSSLGNFFDVSLGRANDLDEFSEGLFVIGEHAPQFADVDKAPILPPSVEGRWSVLVDGLNVNGENFTFTTKSKNSTVPQGKLTAFMDTGTSIAEIPPEVADFIYSKIPGSVADNGTWYVPCQGGANLTWYIGGQAFPIHPLDLTAVASGVALPLLNNSDVNLNMTICLGAYHGGIPPYEDVDMVFGDSFLRNVYLSFNFGQNDGRTENGTGSYIQMLSTTNESDAWTDFQLSRSATLTTTPYTIDPNVLAQIPGALHQVSVAINTPSSDTNSTSSSSIASPSSLLSTVGPPSSTGAATGLGSTPTPSAQTSAVAGALADLVMNGAGPSDSGSTSDAAVSLLHKYGPVVIGLLVANVVVMTLLCIVAAVACMRGKIRGGATTRSLPETYDTVSFKETVIEDSEFNAPVRNYSD